MSRIWKSNTLGMTNLNTIMHGDALALLPQLADNSVDLILFSPPYDGIRDYQGEWNLDFAALSMELLRIPKDGTIQHHSQCHGFVQDALSKEAGEDPETKRFGKGFERFIQND